MPHQALADEFAKSAIYAVCEVDMHVRVCVQERGSGKGTAARQINQRKLKAQWVPVGNWISHNRMNTKPVVTRDEFSKTFGAWLKEYSEEHQ